MQLLNVNNEIILFGGIISLMNETNDIYLYRPNSDNK